MKFLRFLLPSALVIAFAVSACDRTPTGVNLPEGIQELQGVVRPAGIKVVRRGTHVLMQNGRETYFLESASVNLHEVEDHEVTVRGTFEANTDPTAAPVLIVDEIIKDELSTRTWSLPILNISFDVPKDWVGALTGDHASFTASGSLKTVLNVYAQPLEKAPFQALADPGEDRQIMPVVIAGKRALRLIDESTGAQSIYIDLGAQVENAALRVITFEYDPPANLTEAQARETMLRLAQSVTVGAKAKSSASSSRGMTVTGTGSSFGNEGAPCGGTAGVLCPAGYYCDVTDLEANIGRCKKL